MKYKLLVLALVPFIFCSCGDMMMQQGSDRVPAFNPAKIAPVYVAHLEGEDHGLDAKIAAALRRRGISATHGEKARMPASTATRLDYYDKWYWDITPYLLQLDMKLYDASTKQLIASGNSRRTSLVRKSEDEMVEEVLNLLLTGRAE